MERKHIFSEGKLVFVVASVQRGMVCGYKEKSEDYYFCTSAYPLALCVSAIPCIHLGSGSNAYLACTQHLR